MAELWTGQPLPDLLDELQLTQVQLSTINPAAEDYQSDKMELENRIKYLKHEIMQARRAAGATAFAASSAEGANAGNQSFTDSFSEPFNTSANDYSDISRPSTSSSSTSFHNLQPSGFLGSLGSPNTMLPNRKRQRESLDVSPEFRPQAKSHRPSPSPAASIASSPTVSSSDDFAGDVTLRRLFGDSISDEYRGLSKEQKIAEKELQARMEQVRQDEEMARRLQAEFNGQVPSNDRPIVAMPRSTSQTVLDRATGSLRQMPPPPLPAATKPFKSAPSPIYAADASSSTNRKPAAWSAPASSSYRDTYDNNILDLSSDDDDIEEISPSNFTPNAQRVQKPGYQPGPIDLTHPSIVYDMPGAWPGVGGVGGVGGIGGSSVYNRNPAYGMIDSQINGYGTVPSGFGAGLPPGIGYQHPYSTMGPAMPPMHNSMRIFDDDPPENTEEEIKNLLENIRPDEEISPEDREGDPEAMKYPLMAHQKSGLAWMKAMEEGSNKGGILADDMGLGKTIQALALIVARPSEDPTRKTTLIVAPVALMQQWKREIEQKLRHAHRLSVLILHGADRNKPFRELKHYDVILTTYGTLGTEVKRKLQWDEKTKANPNIRPSGRDDMLPILGDECKWYRVILDESQQIKNKTTKAALGAWHIQSLYRWCMSGTPMMNNVTELYSLIHFLRIKPYNSSERFNRDFTRPLKSSYPGSKDRAMQQLQALLKAILLRRTKKSVVDGKPILQLPDKIVEVAHAVFSEDEAIFYKALEDKSQLTFNKYMKAGSVGRNYSNVLVLLLRLRQACCHPHLIKDFAVAANTDLDLKANAEAFGPEVVARLKEVEAFDCPICIDACENPQIFFPCGHAACLDCFSRMADPSQGLAEGRDPDAMVIKCPNCRTPLDPKKVTDLNTFRSVHFPKPEDEASEATGAVKDEDEETATGSETEDDSESDSDTESESGSQSGDSLKNFIVTDGEEDDDEAIKADGCDDDDDDLSVSQPRQKVKDELADDASGSDVKPAGGDKGKRRADVKTHSSERKESKESKKSKKSKKGKGKARDKLEKTELSLAHLRREGLKNKKAKRQYLKKLEEDWVTSAKIEKTMEILQAVHDRGQGEKTIVFSAFTSLLDLLEVPVSNKNWGYRRYDGSMRPAERNEAVLEFTDKARCTVMLVSLKAGNAGLNLTCANHVVIFDPFWNPYIEEQAIDRAYRIGQMKEVHVHRLIVPETVEDRILTLQEKKRELIENALDENAGRSVARLGERELAFLFGLRRGV